jgi:hypothetical protein
MSTFEAKARGEGLGERPDPGTPVSRGEPSLPGGASDQPRCGETLVQVRGHHRDGPLPRPCGDPPHPRSTPMSTTPADKNFSDQNAVG